MMHKLIILFLFLQCFSVSKAATVNFEVNFIDHEKLLAYNFEPHGYANYQKAFQDSILDFFADFKEAQNVRIIQTLDPNLYPYYSFSAKPALHDTLRHSLQKVLMSIRPITSLHIPFSSEHIITINGGNKDRGLDYSPQLTNPLNMRQSKYEFGDFKQNNDFLYHWLQNGAMPILSKMIKSSVQHNNIELTTEEKKAFRTISEGVDANFQTALIRNTRYWNVMQKMPSDDRTLLVFNAMHMGANGRIQYAQKTLQMVYQFESSHTLLRYMMDEFNWRMNYYLQKEQGLLSSISRNYDETRHEADLEKLQSILDINPNSEETLARLFLLVDNVQYAVYPWGNELRNFNLSDPMRQDTIIAKSSQEAYNNYLRGSTADMFIDAETFENDFPKYAEIALKLNAYEFAADLYWMLANKAKSEANKNADTYFFRHQYALHKLLPDAPISKKLKKRFKRLDKKFRKEMKRHPRYKNFKN